MVGLGLWWVRVSVCNYEDYILKCKRSRRF